MGAIATLVAVALVLGLIRIALLGIALPVLAFRRGDEFEVEHGKWPSRQRFKTGGSRPSEIEGPAHDYADPNGIKSKDDLISLEQVMERSR